MLVLTSCSCYLGLEFGIFFYLNKNLIVQNYSGGVIMPNSAAALKEAVEFEKKALEKYQEAASIVEHPETKETLQKLTTEKQQTIESMHWIIMAEAGLLGGVSLGLGLIVGVVLSLILIFVINVQSFGWTIQIHFPVMLLVQSSLFILVATAVSGLYPARLATRFTFADLRED